VALALSFLVLGGTVAAQAPDSAAPYPQQLPRFTLHEIVIERNDSLLRIPGPWLRAAARTFPDSLVTRSYVVAASRIPLTPLGQAALESERSQHVMGLYHRAELLEASRRTLEAIREAIPSDSTRARFDAIFRSHGQWVVDLHEAALAWVRSRNPAIHWADAWRSLAAAHWVDPSDSSIAQEAIPRALYGLALLSETDSAAFSDARAGLWRADSSSAMPVFALLQGYAAARQWYAAALGFFLNQPWIPDGGGRSVRDLVNDEWRHVLASDTAVPIPAIEPHWFGYPQAVPHYGVPPRLFARLVRAENPTGTEWLRRQGQAGLLRSLRSLPQGDSTLVLLQTSSETLRLTTVSRQARESLNGFLEPQDAIAIDPGYSPLLGLGAVVHEWQHLLFRRCQLERYADGLGHRDTRIVRLPAVEPHLAEGFAEWSAERILDPVVRRWPLIGLGELEKRAGLVQAHSDDQHALGYALVRALAAALPQLELTTELLLRYADAPAGLLNEPKLRKAWSQYHGGSQVAAGAASPRILMPEVTFTIEDGVPDVESTRILLPPGSDARR